MLCSLFVTLIATAQQVENSAGKKNFSIKGILIDTLLNQPVPEATVSLINGKDASLVAFTRTDSAGNFLFRQLPAGSYRLSASHVNFYTEWKNVEASEDTNLGIVYMKDKSMMQGVTVIAQRPPVVVNGDTLEFNAESFTTKPNAVIEDMLKKMPGIEVDREGNIRVNGKRINRLLVNGKDFFNGDPKMATRNLPADAVDKVQVFEKPSDQTAFTGVDDGNTETTLNLKLKKDKANAVFGKAGMAAGNDKRYDGQFNINKFSNEQQLSAIGMANNINRQGFSMMDMLNFTGQSRRMMGSGGRIVINNGGPEDFGLPVDGMSNNQGIVQTIAGGLNYNDNWRKKTEVNASYFYNNLDIGNDRKIHRQSILPGNNFILLQNSNNNNKTQSNRINFSIDHKIDSFNSIKLTSLLGHQKGKTFSESNYVSFIPDDDTLNNGFSNNTRNMEGYITNNSLLYRHKFKKKGRTFSVNTSTEHNDSRSNGVQHSINNFFNGGAITRRDTLDQINKLNSLTQNLAATINYTEPLSKRSLLELRGMYTVNTGRLDRRAFDYNKSSGKYDQINTSLSSAFESKYNYTAGGVSVRVQQKKYGYTIGANVQYTRLNSHLKDSAFSVGQKFTNLLPLANFNYSFSKMKTMRLDYATSTTAPTGTQLQPVKDISDPLNIVEGNPALKQAYNHSIVLQFFNANPSKQKNLFAFLNYTATQNAIVNSDVINNGARTTQPVNADGVYNVQGNIERNFRVKKTNTRLGIGAFVNYNHSVNFINRQKNKTGNLALAPRISASYNYKEIIDINAEAVVSYNEARYSLQPMLNNYYWRQTYELIATVYLPAGFSINNEFTYSAYTGRVSGYNTYVALWNAAISKQIFKSRKGEIKVSAFDLLQQNIGITRNGNSNYVEDMQYKTLQRYFTIGFTYSLQKPMTGGPRMVMRRF